MCLIGSEFIKCPIEQQKFANRFKTSKYSKKSCFHNDKDEKMEDIIKSALKSELKLNKWLVD